MHPIAPPTITGGAARHSRISTSTTARARTTMATTAVHRSMANGCQAAVRPATHSRNTARPIHRPPADLPRARESEIACFEAKEPAEEGSTELAPSALVRLIRPHRILKSLKNRTANRRRPGDTMPANYIVCIYLSVLRRQGKTGVDICWRLEEHGKLFRGGKSAVRARRRHTKDPT